MIWGLSLLIMCTIIHNFEFFYSIFVTLSKFLGGKTNVRNKRHKVKRFASK